MPRVPHVPCRALLCLAALATAGRPAGAQSVQGRVVDAQNDRALAGAVIRLLDGSGEGVATAAADANGRYRIAVAEPGTYRLRAEQLGYETLDSEPFSVESGADAVSVDLRMRPSPIPIRGVEVSDDRVNRRLREFLGMSPAQLRIRPIRAPAIRDHAMRGSNLSEMMDRLAIPNLQVLRTRDGPCYQFRSRGCLPVYLDGARLSGTSVSTVPLEMLSTVVILLPSETVAYPAGAVHLYSTGFMR